MPPQTAWLDTCRSLPAARPEAMPPGHGAAVQKHRARRLAPGQHFPTPACKRSVAQVETSAIPQCRHGEPLAISAGRRHPTDRGLHKSKSPCLCTCNPAVSETSAQAALELMGEDAANRARHGPQPLQSLDDAPRRNISLAGASMRVGRFALTASALARCPGR